MKKLIVAAAIMMGFVSFANAQQPQASPTGIKNMSPKGMAASHKTKPAATKQVVTNGTTVKTAGSVKGVSATKPVKSTAVVLKKDGTLDMRYSKNKKAAKS